MAFKPDIIVLDFDFDGDVVARLQASEKTRDIPVVALAKLTGAD